MRRKHGRHNEDMKKTGADTGGGALGGTCPPCQKKREEEEERGKKRGKKGEREIMLVSCRAYHNFIQFCTFLASKFAEKNLDPRLKYMTCHIDPFSTPV